jgi:hypothetical protein
MSGPRWTPATFEIAMGEQRDGAAVFRHRETVEGETWGAFGINRDGDGERCAEWVVTHLPTGYLLVSAESKAAAKRFVREVAPFTDWTAVKACPPEIKDAVLAAWWRARGATFVEVGTTS